MFTVIRRMGVFSPYLMSMSGESQEDGSLRTIFIIMGVIAMVAIYQSGKFNDKERENLALRNSARKEKFNPNVNDPIPIDENNQLFKINRNRWEIFNFNELIDFKLYQDNNTLTSGQRGAALNVGGVILGGTLSNTSSAEVEKIDIVVNMIGKNPGRYTVNFLTKPVRQNSESYRLAIEKAERTVNILNRILEYRDGNSLSNSNENQFDNFKKEERLIKQSNDQNNETVLNASIKEVNGRTNSNTEDSVEIDNKKEIEAVGFEELITLEGTFLQALTSTTYMFASKNGQNYIVESEQDLAILLGVKIKFSGILLSKSEIGSESIGIVKLEKIEKLI